MAKNKSTRKTKKSKKHQTAPKEGKGQDTVASKKTKQQTTGQKSTVAKNKPAKPVDESVVGTCGCGCGAKVREGRRYVQGHDAKHKSLLLTAAAAGDKDALKLLVSLGWADAEQVARRAKKDARKEAYKRFLADVKKANAA